MAFPALGGVPGLMASWGPLQPSTLSGSWHSEGGVAAYTGSSAEASGGEDWLCLECEMEIQELSEQA